MELFVLGVGNYGEQEVEVATATWTGWTLPWWVEAAPCSVNVDFDSERHDPSPLSVFGVPINAGSGDQAGFEVINAMLGGGVVPAGARANAGVAMKVVAANFLSFKLWQEFGEADREVVPRMCFP